MTLHFSPASLDDALPHVLSIARQIDAEGLSAAERANVAITYVIETSGLMWSMAFQREILASATAALQSAEPPVLAPAPLRAHIAAPSAMPPIATEPALSPEPAPDTSTTMMTLANVVVQALSEILDFSDLADRSRAEQEKLIHDAIHSLTEQKKMHLK